MGPSYSCNLGAKKSNAEYIAILNRRYMLKYKLEKQINIAETNNLDFCVLQLFY